MITSAAIIIIGIKLGSPVLATMGIIAAGKSFVELVWRIANDEQNDYKTKGAVM